jgi:hypothetical protein
MRMKLRTRCQARVLIRRLRILSSPQWSVSGTEGVSKPVLSLSKGVRSLSRR